MIKFVVKELQSYGAEVTVDGTGNIYAKKGESESYPCVVAHLDQVSSHTHSRDFRVIDKKGVMFGYSNSNKQHEGIGADDKNGIWVALKCMHKYDVMKCAFFVGEEIGCMGSMRADETFFADCRFVVQCDRKGNSDLVYSICGKITSDEFLADTNFEKFGYELSTGLSTDVGELRERIALSMVNMSCGYYNPHTDNEFTVIEDLQKCLYFVYNIVENCTKVYKYEIQDNYGYFGRWSGSSRYEDIDCYDDDVLEIDDCEAVMYADLRVSLLDEQMEWSEEDAIECYSNTYFLTIPTLRDIYERTVKSLVKDNLEYCRHYGLYKDYWPREDMSDVFEDWIMHDIRITPFKHSDGKARYFLSHDNAIMIVTTEELKEWLCNNAEEMKRVIHLKGSSSKAEAV